MTVFIHSVQKKQAREQIPFQFFFSPCKSARMTVLHLHAQANRFAMTDGLCTAQALFLIVCLQHNQSVSVQEKNLVIDLQLLSESHAHETLPPKPSSSHPHAKHKTSTLRNLFKDKPFFHL